VKAREQTDFVIAGEEKARLKTRPRAKELGVRVLDEERVFEDEWEGVGVRIAGRLACGVGRRDGLLAGGPALLFFAHAQSRESTARKDLRPGCFAWLHL